MMLVVMKKMMITMIMIMINIQRSIIKSTCIDHSVAALPGPTVCVFGLLLLPVSVFLVFPDPGLQTPDKCHLFSWKQQ